MNSMTVEHKTDISLPDLSTPEAVVSAVKKGKELNPANRMLKYFNTDWYLTLPKDKQERVLQITRSGFVNEGRDAEVGPYAMQTTDYAEFPEIFDPIAQDYHSISPDFRFRTDWNINDKKLDLKDIDSTLNNVSMRSRVARNVEGFPMTGSMTREDRIKFENYMVSTVFKKLTDDPKYGGRYVSLTPGSDYEISTEEYQKLVDAHQMFKDMSNDPYLTAGGISSNWPYGRGMYISEDEQKIVWVGEEDQLRIMNMQKGSDLSSIFNGLKEELDLFEKFGVRFAKSDKYGYVTSCPSNLGTGMRASLHLRLPNLTEKGQNVDKLKAILKEAGVNVSVRGAGGEHTAAGSDGLVDVSPRGRMIPENVVITELYQAASKLLALENK
jgi:hypothetical protein